MLPEESATVLLTRLAQWNMLVSKFQKATSHTAKASKS